MNLAIGESTAEEIKKQIGCAMPLVTEMSLEVSGRDLTTGLPQTVKITSTQVEEAIQESIDKIVEIIKQTLERTPPEFIFRHHGKRYIPFRRRSTNKKLRQVDFGKNRNASVRSRRPT